MEPGAYSDQLIEVLRQLRARVIEVQAGQYDQNERTAIDLELLQMLQDALGIALRWSGARRPQPLPPGADLRTIGNDAGRLGDLLRLEEDLVGAIQAIRPDFSVEAIDNAIRVAESQA